MVGSVLYICIFIHVYVLQEMGMGCLHLFSAWVDLCHWLDVNVDVDVSCACVSYLEYMFSLSTGWTWVNGAAIA